MKYFCSPLKLIGLIKDMGWIKSESAQQKNRYGKWYYSSAGKKAYEKAKTPAEKTMYFFDYLTAVSNSKNSDVNFRIAYVMANSMDSSEEFGGYPKILSYKDNPLVNYMAFDASSAALEVNPFGAAKLLAVLNNEQNAEIFFDAESKPYERLTYCNSDGSASDRYKIERDIIGAFCSDASNDTMPLYVYNILTPVLKEWDKREKEQTLNGGI